MRCSPAVCSHLAVTTRGFADVLQIGDQNRPRLFDLEIPPPTLLYETVLEADERLADDGEVLQSLDEGQLRDGLQRLKQSGIESLAVCLLHAWKDRVHERRIAEIARELGFAEISLSHETAPTMRIVPGAATPPRSTPTSIRCSALTSPVCGIRFPAANCG